MAIKNRKLLWILAQTFNAEIWDQPSFLYPDIPRPGPFRGGLIRFLFRTNPNTMLATTPDSATKFQSAIHHLEYRTDSYLGRYEDGYSPRSHGVQVVYMWTVDVFCD